MENYKIISNIIFDDFIYEQFLSYYNRQYKIKDSVFEKIKCAFRKTIFFLTEQMRKYKKLSLFK